MVGTNYWNSSPFQGSSPKIQQCFKEGELCKTALTCHFALDDVYMSMEW